MTSAQLHICAGMRRSGSTLQAQLVAELLGGVAIEVVGPEGQLPDTPGASGPRVLKCHRFVPALADACARGEARVFYTYRDLRDVVASIVRKYDASPLGFVHGGVRKLLDEHAAWTAVPGTYVARYETMVDGLEAEVHRLAQALGRPVEAVRAQDIAARYSVARQRERIAEAFAADDAVVGERDNAHDRASLLHRDHIQSGGSGEYRRVLTPREVAAIEWIARDWMQDHRYAPDHPRWRQALAYASYRGHARLHAIKRRLSGAPPRPGPAA